MVPGIAGARHPGKESQVPGTLESEAPWKVGILRGARHLGRGDLEPPWGGGARGARKVRVQAGTRP